MRVTCQILNYNDADHVVRLVKKIIDYKLIDNILIVDNCSTDNSYSLLKKVFFNNIKVKVIKTLSNRGYGVGNNFGVNYAFNYLKSDYVLLSNPDVFFTENVIKSLIDAMLNDSNNGICAPTQKIKGKVIKERAWKIPTKFQYVFGETRLAKLIGSTSLYKSSYFSSSRSGVDCVPGALLLLNVRKFLDIGGYDERMFLYCEETTIGFKMKKRGYSTILLNNEFYDHIQSTSINKSIDDNVKQRYYIYYNRLIFLRDYLNASRVWLYIAKKVFNYLLNRLSKGTQNNEKKQRLNFPKGNSKNGIGNFKIFK
ncbi:glycosyltransferase family 2 protein [Limosilactobacillus vaginalis]|uniref:glycosyltransferase family 2 protein n=1 Tax=Limosilactobacillus vaginalis TaxID=1633 RepID=UPI0025A4815F|nr:glycosyltransferase family 2 protein [Limosilactobacillus vaginalis]MDM8261386.1 glycosyltransferase family 2 protein [Limosilactobacillus vaginalis]